MILLLNLLPVVIFAIGTHISIKRRSWRVALATILILFVYAKAQPSYMPKGEVKRSDIPAFEVSKGVIQDRNSKPVTGEERDRIMKEKVSNGLDFLKKDE